MEESSKPSRSSVRSSVRESLLTKLEFQLWGFVSKTVGGTESFTIG